MIISTKKSKKTKLNKSSNTELTIIPYGGVGVGGGGRGGWGYSKGQAQCAN